MQLDVSRVPKMALNNGHSRKLIQITHHDVYTQYEKNNTG